MKVPADLESMQLLCRMFAALNESSLTRPEQVTIVSLILVTALKEAKMEAQLEKLTPWLEQLEQA